MSTPSNTPQHTPRHPRECRICIKSAGEMASGVAARLHKAGFTSIVMLETDVPMAVRRSVSFSEAVHDGHQTVEEVTARRAAPTPEAVRAVWGLGAVAVVVDPGWTLLESLRPHVSVDAIIAKRNTGTRRDEADLVVALGPGFTAGVDTDVVIETQRGHNLGRIYREGGAAPNTGIPGDIAGHTLTRVLRAARGGLLRTSHAIGDMVRQGDVICTVDGEEVTAGVSGVLRGCLRDHTPVRAGTKLGDIDPRGQWAYCFSISEKARTLGGATLEAVCAHWFKS